MNPTNVIDSLFVALGFEVDTKGAEEFKASAMGLVKTAALVATAMTAAATGVGLFVSSIAEGIDDLGDWAEREEFGIEAAQELGYAAQLSGSSLDALKASVEGVNRVVGEAAIGIGRGAQTFAKLGISARDSEGAVKSVDEILEEVADRMAGMSRRESIALAEKLGIDRSLIPLLMKGRDEIEKLREEARAFGVTTEEQAAEAGALADSLDRIRFVVSSVRKSIAVALMPAVREIIDDFREWIVEIGKFVKSNFVPFLENIGTAVARTWGWIRRFFGAISDGIGYVLQLRGVLVAAATALAIWLLPMISLPMLIGAAIAAIWLFLDDFEAWQNGQDSLIGGLLEKFPEVRDWIVAIWAVLRTAWDLIVMSMKGWVILLDMVGQAIEDIVGRMIRFGKSVLEVFGVVKGAIIAAKDWVVGFIDSIDKAIDRLLELAKKANVFNEGVNAVVRFATGDKDQTLGGLVFDTFNGPAAGSAPSVVRSGVLGKAADQTTNNRTASTTTNTTQIQAPITVVSPDPNRAGEAVREEFDRINKQATRNGQSAVDL